MLILFIMLLLASSCMIRNFILNTSKIKTLDTAFCQELYNSIEWMLRVNFLKHAVSVSTSFK